MISLFGGCESKEGSTYRCADFERKHALYIFTKVKVKNRQLRSVAGKRNGDHNGRLQTAAIALVGPCATFAHGRQTTVLPQLRVDFVFFARKLSHPRTAIFSRAWLSRI